MPGGCTGETGSRILATTPAHACLRWGISAVLAGTAAIPCPSRRSGRVAEGGALLRRYVGEFLHRGFESLLLRWGPAGPPARRGGRAVECGGLENRSGCKPRGGSNPSLSAQAGNRRTMRLPASCRARPRLL